MKKLVSIVLALAMILMVGAAFAGTIDVQNVIDDEEYAAYKILNYTSNGTSVSYYLTASEYASIGSVLIDAGFEFEASSDGTQYYLSNGEELVTSGVSDAAAYLGSHLADLGNALGKYEATGANGEAAFTNLPTGYFFITSSAGSLCGLHSDDGIATVVEKNTIPEVDKKEKLAADPTYVDGPIDAHIGETVNFQIVITDGTGTNADLTMTDTMTDGLDYTASSLKINGTAVADDADTDNWKVTISGRTIEIVFKAAYVATVGTGEAITVTYDATTNEDAVIDSATGNKNEVTIEYSHQTDTDHVYVETYDFIVYKTDGTDFLDGAEFKLYTLATGGEQILIADEGNGEYVKDPTASADVTIDINSADGCHVRGLAPGIYYLEEVVVPDGYNKLAAREPVTISTGATAAVEITVENTAGTILPNTGGIGTTIFYIVGGVLLIGAAVILVARRKAHD